MAALQLSENHHPLFFDVTGQTATGNNFVRRIKNDEFYIIWIEI